MADTPNKYDDPYWSNLAANTETKLNLPKGLLKSIVVNGERSNNNQVSEAGARTPFQIIPKTRIQAIKAYGIDPYLSPENAAEVAGNLLKDSLKRNDGDINAAVSEYHGGTNRDNWGPKTRAYVGRVVSGLEPTQSLPDESKSTFDKIQSQQQQPTSQLAAIHQAYLSGKMNPDEKSQYEADVKAGNIMLPRGASLQGAEKPQADNTLPQSVADAYYSGKMNPDEKSQLENDIKSGLVKLPQLKSDLIPGQPGMTPQEKLKAQEDNSTLTDKLIGAGEAGLSTATGLTSGAVGQVLGTGKGIAQSVMNGTYGTQEGVRNVEQAAEQGAGALTYQPSSAKGQEYTNNIGEGMAALTPVMPLTAELGALGQGVSSGTRLARQMAAPAVTQAVESVKPAITNVVDSIRRNPQEAAVLENATPVQAPNPTQANPTAPKAVEAPLMSGEQLTDTARKAASGGFGSSKATENLAEQVAPNQKTIEAAQRLGIEDYLQPDHVTTNQSYRELAQAAKSIPGSEARAAEIVGLEQVGRKANNLIDEIGGTQDLSSLDSSVKNRMQSTIKELSDKSEQLYSQVKKAIPANTPVEAPNTLGFMSNHINDLGGIERLPVIEKKLYNALKGDDGPITYAYLDQQRKLIGKALEKSNGPFADSETGLLKKLYSTLSDDQGVIADKHGVSTTFKAAKDSISLRKGIEDDLRGLYGKNIDGSLVGDLTSAVKSVSSGDVSKLSKLLQSTPENMRQEMMASGLNTAFGKATQNGTLNFNTYAKWYEGLLKNKQAYSMVMSNLPSPARKQLSDLYRVSKGVSQATRERITTGRINAVKDQLQSKDASTLRNLATGLAKGAAAEVATSAVGLHGAGLVSGITSAIVKGKPDTLKAVDTLISSPKFSEKVAKSKEVARKAKAAKAKANKGG